VALFHWMYGKTNTEESAKKLQLSYNGQQSCSKHKRQSKQETRDAGSYLQF